MKALWFRYRQRGLVIVSALILASLLLGTAGAENIAIAGKNPIQADPAPLAATVGKLLFNMYPRYGRISGTATPTFGEGGNYIPERAEDKSDVVKSLRGKAENGGGNPYITGKGDAKRVVFTSSGVTSGNSRCELATGPQFPFGKAYQIRFKFRYDGPVHQSGHFYLLQIWQAVYSPIAGIRMIPGTKDVELVGLGIGAAARTTMKPGEWVDWKIRIKVGKDGYIKVWDNATGAKLGEVNGTFGHMGSNDPKEWRPKFGIYKAANSGTFKVEVNSFILNEMK